MAVHDSVALRDKDAELFARQLEIARKADGYNGWIAEQFMPFVGRRVLELGCGIGSLLQYWSDRELVVGVDLELGCVEKSRERFAGRSNVRIVHDAAGSPGWVEKWTKERFDTVVMVNVLEHIREDLDALNGCRSIVEAGGGGHICIFVPAFEFAFSEFDRRHGHFRRYTKATLREKLLQAGLEVQVLRYFNMPGLFAWWATFVLLGREDSTPGEVGFYSKFVVPAARAIESKVPPPFGNSVVAVCKVLPKR